ncbi:uncharacterized protein MELLADRAFT_109049 [Melampsora larici-populina 98AG31]|uniref:Uncharacterized protein n=1 Tax=Melampsora larici-populina (strain 98AG31 / pathotype 3-4-7) TaxID=747676 RepID=F4RV61_MELLP|nr:uncharacterized protein MELLADRAFT_109049 [Melampsora larici-populina 98AG31]EGG03564.1 hypothetical protein MELLADRAFT_109049 [Melampsora larici-populina 98AG31]
MCWKYLFQVIILTRDLPSYSAFQPKPSPSSIIQNFAEGNLWLDNSIPEEENLQHLVLPEIQDLSGFHDGSQNECTHQLSQGAIGHWDSQFSSKESPCFAISRMETASPSTKYQCVPLPLEHGSYLHTEVPISSPQNLGLGFRNEINPQDPTYSSSPFNYGTEAYLAPKEQKLYHELDKWSDTPDSLGTSSQSHSSTPGGPSLLKAMKHTFHESHDVVHNVPSSNMNHYGNIVQEISQSHGRCKETCHTTHDKKRKKVLGDQEFFDLKNDENVPYTHSNGVPFASCTVSNSNDHPSKMVNTFHLSEEWKAGNHKPIENFGMISSRLAEGPMQNLKESSKEDYGLADDRFLNEGLPLYSPHVADSNFPSSSTERVLASVMDNSGDTMFLGMGTPTTFNDYVMQGFPALEEEDIGIKDHPSKSPSSDLISPPVIKKPRINAPSKLSSREALPLLRNIGVFYMNNSPSLCYETTSWFNGLQQDMISRCGQETSIIKPVEQAIQIAHSKITACFLALIVIFSKKGGDQLYLNNLLQEAWSFIKLQFGSWRDANLKTQSCHLKVKKHSYTKTGRYDPVSWYRSLSNYNNRSNIPADIINSLVIKWDQNRSITRIGVSNIIKYYPIIQEFHDSHVNYSHGGFYSRSQIKNIAFSGLIYSRGSPVHKYIVFSKWHEICLSLSQSAQFHSPMGIEICQEVHAFFGSLVKDMLSSYKQVYNLDISLARPRPKEKSVDLLYYDPHKKNIETIIRVISMGEYRLTVIFIGLVKAMYQREVQENTLRILVKSAWSFLKVIFSKWKQFDFEKDLPKIFNLEVKTPLEVTMDWSNSIKLFKSLSYDQDTCKYPIPIHGLKRIFEAWSYTLNYSQITHMNGLDLKVKLPPPEVSSFQWAKTLI